MKITIATHNRQSINCALRLMDEEQITARINFAQINGLGDDISLDLAQRGKHVLKLLPCGSIDQVLPWLERQVFMIHLELSSLVM